MSDVDFIRGSVVFTEPSFAVINNVIFISKCFKLVVDNFAKQLNIVIGL